MEKIIILIVAVAVCSFTALSLGRAIYINRTEFEPARLEWEKARQEWDDAHVRGDREGMNKAFNLEIKATEKEIDAAKRSMNLFWFLASKKK